MIQLKNVEKNYIINNTNKTILYDVNLTVNKGDFISIMGRSGSGKSTLLNIVGCLDKPTDGNFLFHDYPINDYNEIKMAEIRNKHIGYVFQHFYLIPRMTIIENVEIPLLYSNVSKKLRKERAIESLTKVGLQDYIDQYPNQLSGGQKQRATIARAIINNPDILIADEPTGSLDIESSNQVMELFTSLNKKEKTTIILVTHEKEIASYARHHYTIINGSLAPVNDYLCEGQI